MAQDYDCKLSLAQVSLRHFVNRRHFPHPTDASLVHRQHLVDVIWPGGVLGFSIGKMQHFHSFFDDDVCFFSSTTSTHVSCSQCTSKYDSNWSSKKGKSSPPSSTQRRICASEVVVVVVVYVDISECRRRRCLLTLLCPWTMCVFIHSVYCPMDCACALKGLAVSDVSIGFST